MFNWLKSKTNALDVSLPAAPPPAAPIGPLEQALALRLEGNAWLDKGHAAAAAASYEKSVALDPNAVDGRINLGFALAEQSCFDEALPHLLEAVRLDPDSIDAHYILGTVQQARQEHGAGIEAWRRTLVLKPDFDECRRSLIVAFVQSGDLSGAENVARDGFVASPGQADFPYLLGNIHTTRSESDQAIESYAKALAIDPKHGQALLAKGEALKAQGEALKAQGKLTEAIESHRRSVTLNPASADARARLAADRKSVV